MQRLLITGDRNSRYILGAQVMGRVASEVSKRVLDIEIFY